MPVNTLQWHWKQIENGWGGLDLTRNLDKQKKKDFEYGYV